MAEKRYRFTNPEQAARRTANLGWDDMSASQLEEQMNRAEEWSCRDSANLARIATALEGIRAELKQMRVAGESRAEAVRIPAGG